MKKRKRPPVNIRRQCREMTEAEVQHFNAARDALLLAFVRHRVSQQIMANGSSPVGDGKELAQLNPLLVTTP